MIEIYGFQNPYVHLIIKLILIVDVVTLTINIFDNALHQSQEGIIFHDGLQPASESLRPRSSPVGWLLDVYLVRTKNSVVREPE